MACGLAAWLHLRCGLSRSATGKVLKVMEIMVVTALNLGAALVRLSHPAANVSTSPRFSLPHDIRTAMSVLSIEPNIIRSICCPKCYTKYAIADMPQVCLYKETNRSKPCNEKLWTTRITKGGPRVVPCRLYSTQDFESWLEFFLLHPGVEELIDKSYAHCPSSDNMHSIWDSPAWRSLGSFTTTHGNLTFSFYIDWFNPFTNKIAGKSASCGAIMMFCLNLPYELQCLPQYTFFAGITPPPHEPSVTTITALSDSIVDHLQAMWQGKKIRTHRHPDGALKRVAVLPTIGDLLAIRKLLGFAGVASHNFCSFCTLQRSEMDNLDYESWTKRTGADVLAGAMEWKSATTKKDRKAFFKKNGVRWSSLHRLTYRDPVQHTVLGVMHNWIEGILQHQARVKWGIGIIPAAQGNENADEAISATPPSSPLPFNKLDLDVEMLDEEITALYEESRQYQDRPEHVKRLHSQASFFMAEQQLEGGHDDADESPNDDEFFPGEVSDTDTEAEADDNLEAWKAVCIFDSTSLAMIRQCLSDTVIPSWLERPPVNLGEKRHGKLKADQWLQLFTVFLPLILPEIWLAESNPRHTALLSNFHDLVACTNIVCSYSVSSASADLYLYHFIQYRKSSKILFPNVNTRPNHHYAMHNADLMKFWGPLIKLSEFPYERHNGNLQKIKTNSHMCKSPTLFESGLH